MHLQFSTEHSTYRSHRYIKNTYLKQHPHQRHFSHSFRVGLCQDHGGIQAGTDQWDYKQISGTMKTRVSVTCLHELMGSLFGDGWPDNYEQTWNGQDPAQKVSRQPCVKRLPFYFLKKKKKKIRKGTQKKKILKNKWYILTYLTLKHNILFPSHGFRKLIFCTL